MQNATKLVHATTLLPLTPSLSEAGANRPPTSLGDFLPWSPSAANKTLTSLEVSGEALKGGGSPSAANKALASLVPGEKGGGYAGSPPRGGGCDKGGRRPLGRPGMAGHLGYGKFQQFNAKCLVLA